MFKKTKLFAMFASAMVALNANSAEENWGERAAWNRAKVRTNVLGLYDLLDYPHPIKAGTFPLEKVDGGALDPAKDLAGKIVMLMYINPKLVKEWGKNDKLVQRYQKLYDEFKDDITFLTIYSEGRKTNKEKGIAYFKKFNPPGIHLFEKKYKRGGGIKSFCGFKKSAAYKSTPLAILGKDGNIAYREWNFGFHINAYRNMLKRLTNEKYDSEIRKNFPSQKRALPIVNEESNALVYKDDFESYKNGFDLKVSPRWGFQYFTQYRLDSRAGIIKEGRDNSQAAYIYCDYLRYKEGGVTALVRKNLEHDFAAPLKNGEFEFYLKAKKMKTPDISRMISQSGKAVLNNSILSTQMIITLRESSSIAPAGYLIIKNGTFILATDTPFVRDIKEVGKIKVSKNWHNIKVKVVNGNSELFVDDKPLGKLLGKNIIGLHFRCLVENEFLIDDVKISYTGNPVTIKKEISAYIAKSKQTQVGKGTYTKPEKMQFDTENRQLFGSVLKKPLPTNGDLNLEKLYYPGTYVNINKDNNNKPTFISVSRDRPVTTAFSRLFNEPATPIYDLRKQLIDEYNDKINMYDATSLYLEYIISDYEEMRDLRHEHIVAKEKIRKIYGYVACWEFASENDKDKYLLNPFSDMSSLNWRRVKGEHPMTGKHGNTGSMEFMSFILLDKNSDIIYRAGGVEHPYKDCFPLFDAVLNDNKIKPTSKTLPIKNGNVYKDDFESYNKNNKIVSAECWGFDYEKDFHKGERGKGSDFRIPNVTIGRSQTLHGAIAKGEGRNGSQALRLDTTFYFVRSFEDKHYAPRDYAYENWRGQIGKRHLFPKPMTNGSFTYYLRPGPKAGERNVLSRRKANKSHSNEWFFMDILKSKSKILDTIITDGAMKQTKLKLEKNGSQSVSIAPKEWKNDFFGAQLPVDKTWHKVTVAIANGTITVTVDDKSIGSFSAESFSGITMHTRCTESMFVDDVELKYNN